MCIIRWLRNGAETSELVASSELGFWRTKSRREEVKEKEKPVGKRAVLVVSLWGGKERNPRYN